MFSSCQSAPAVKTHFNILPSSSSSLLHRRPPSEPPPQSTQPHFKIGRILKYNQRAPAKPRPAPHRTTSLPHRTTSLPHRATSLPHRISAPPHRTTQPHRTSEGRRHPAPHRTSPLRMPNNENNTQRRQVISGASIVAGAVGVIVGLAAAEHAHAQDQNRESVVEGIGRWIRDSVFDSHGNAASPTSAAAAGTTSPSSHFHSPHHSSHHAHYHSGSSSTTSAFTTSPLSANPSNPGNTPYHPHTPAPVHYPQQPGRAVHVASVSSPVQSAGARRPLMRCEVNVLPVRRYLKGSGGSGKPASEGTEKDFCVVCRENYEHGDSLLRLPCIHEFHTDCIRDYLETCHGPLCPICRHPVTVT